MRQLSIPGHSFNNNAKGTTYIIIVKRKNDIVILRSCDDGWIPIQGSTYIPLLIAGIKSRVIGRIEFFYKRIAKYFITVQAFSGFRFYITTPAGINGDSSIGAIKSTHEGRAKYFYISYIVNV